MTYNYEDDPAYVKHLEEMEAEEEARVASGGLELCPTCEQRSVKVTTKYTKNYGGGWDTFYKCQTEGCTYWEVCV
jgi:DNA-directed RNA polymerase subunit M/transcription elongation factor TFIIS